MAESRWSSSASHEVLLQRALMLKNIRAFFDARGVLEVETPLLSHFATTDPHLDSLVTRFRDQPLYLNTSPEYAMKRLLATLRQPIYQVCKAFRDDELGPNHNPEFSLLEWYRPGFDMRQLMAELSALVTELLAKKYVPEQRSDTFSTVQAAPEFERQSYQQAFLQFTGIDPHQASSADCERYARQQGVEIPQGLTAEDTVDDWLDWLLTQCVLPAFDKRGFTFLYDYPATQCALARVETNEQQQIVARRFELFYGEVELANGFYELTDADEQLQRFRQENSRRRAANKAEVAIDERLIAALAHGLPVCSGVAVGLDRLLMVIIGLEQIGGSLAFPWADC